MAKKPTTVFLEGEMIQWLQSANLNVSSLCRALLLEYRRHEEAKINPAGLIHEYLLGDCEF